MNYIYILYIYIMNMLYFFFEIHAYASYICILYYNVEILLVPLVPIPPYPKRELGTLASCIKLSFRQTESYG